MWSTVPLILLSLVPTSKGIVDPIEYACNSTHAKDNWFIYCSGSILEAVNYHRLYNDSKDFVDSPLKQHPDVTKAAFDKRFGALNTSDINRDDLQKFIYDFFLPPGAELSTCTPADWVEKPARLMAIQDPKMRQWALEINTIWKTLCKKIHPSILERKSQYSLIYMPNEFIAPGGRFRESYYWDTLWIIKGLLASEMYDSAKQMIANLALLVETYGFVPNGARIYYLGRSQPPMLTAMVFDYYEATRDVVFLRSVLPTLDKEVMYWDLHRSISVVDPNSGDSYIAYRHYADCNTPRPESFKEDTALAVNMTPEEQQFFYRSIHSAAETGWDFSTRWLRDGANLSSIETVNILPIDLNSVMCWNFGLLSTLYMRSGNTSFARLYRARQLAMMDMLESLFYNETLGAWFDFNLRTNQQNTRFYTSVAVPLFANCYARDDVVKTDRLYTFLNDSGVFNFPGGVPTSMVQGSGEQWDYPNGWPNTNHMLIEGLRKSENAHGQERAYQLAKKWTAANYRVWKKTGKMYEKYDVSGKSEPGGGGEYVVQEGFGWTNGVILDLLVSYADRMEAPPPDDNDGGSENVRPSSLCLMIIAALVYLIAIDA